MTLNLSWIDDFMVLAETGNFSRAAEERHMTQPAFSRRIRALEDWLGVELFDRSSQPARLTDAGLWFRKSAQELQAQVARIPGEARAIAEASSQTLRFAATHALSFSFMPRWLRALETRTSVGPVNLVSDTQQKCEALLQQGGRCIRALARTCGGRRTVGRGRVPACRRLARASAGAGVAGRDAAAGLQLGVGARTHPARAQGTRAGAAQRAAGDDGGSGLGAAHDGARRARSGLVAGDLGGRGPRGGPAGAGRRCRLASGPGDPSASRSQRDGVAAQAFWDAAEAASKT
ncbi:bacterial regulatory helix-turn-helix protein, lysR family domain-containing protein [Ditylenchus destructor]|nr:bacterial regulatory helix-turn-helix protein, lysR family domain-containing protein [Ditylenchus destructor]